MPEPSAEFREQALTHLDTLYNFALRLTKRPPDADDLVQETYLRAFRFAHRFEPGTHLRAWLFQILRNTFLTFYRRETHQPVLLDKDLDDGLEEAPAGEAPDPAVFSRRICNVLLDRPCDASIRPYMIAMMPSSSSWPL